MNPETNELPAESVAKQLPINITRSMLFRGKQPKKGNIFYIAKYIYAKQKFEAGFEIIIAEETKQGEEAIRNMIKQLVLDKING